MRSRLRSFRVRLTLMSMLVSAVVLVAFGLPAWLLLNALGLQRIDSEVRAQALPHLGVFPDNRHWGELADVLRYARGAAAAASFVVVKGRGDRLVFRSEFVPPTLRPERFPRPGEADSGMRLLQPPPPPRTTSPSLMPPPPPPAHLRRPLAYTWHEGRHTWRMAVLGNEHFTAIIGVSLASHQAQMRLTALALVGALPLALLLVAWGSWLLAGRALRPVHTLTETAGGITAQGLDQRLATEGEDEEFARLITVFNEMLDRLQRSFEQATRFSADAAHELKTPLAVLQGELEQALQQAPTGSREQQVYGDLLEEVQRLKVIIRKLLLLSLADAGRLELHRTPFDLTAAVRALSEDLEVLGPGLTITCQAEPGVTVAADPELLEQVLQNLASNAVKYNQPGGKVDCQLAKVGETARLAVSNTGPGVPEADRDKVFERFYRADKSRGRRVDGTGLGLSLSREIARAHGGDLRLETASPEVTRFVLELPLQT